MGKLPERSETRPKAGAADGSPGSISQDVSRVRTGAPITRRAETNVSPVRAQLYFGRSGPVAFKAGAHCFLIKPLDEDAFINCLDRALVA